MRIRKTAVDKAIESLEAEKRVIDLAIAKLRATNEKKPAAGRIRRVAPQGILAHGVIDVEGAK